MEEIDVIVDYLEELSITDCNHEPSPSHSLSVPTTNSPETSSMEYSNCTPVTSQLQNSTCSNNNETFNVNIPQSSNLMSCSNATVNAQDSVSKIWHQEINTVQRELMTKRLINAILPSSVLPATISPHVLKNLEEYTKKVESNIYEVANSISEYKHLLAEKYYKINKELKERAKARRVLQAHQLLQQLLQHQVPPVYNGINVLNHPDLQKESSAYNHETLSSSNFIPTEREQEVEFQTVQHSQNNQILFSKFPKSRSSPFLTNVTVNAQTNDSKAWHTQVDTPQRERIVKKLFEALLPTSDRSVKPSNVVLKNLEAYTKKVESDIYEVANSKSEYFHLMAEKYYKILKELDERRQARRLRAQQQSQTPSVYDGINILNHPDLQRESSAYNRETSSNCNLVRIERKRKAELPTLQHSHFDQTLFTKIPKSRSSLFPISTTVNTQTNSSKVWHEQVDTPRREELVKKLFEAILPTSHRSVKFSPGVLKNLEAYTKKVESDIYEVANSKNEYFHLMAEKYHKIIKELDERRQARRLQAQQQSQTPSACDNQPDPHRESSTNGRATVASCQKAIKEWHETFDFNIRKDYVEKILEIIAANPNLYERIIISGGSVGASDGDKKLRDHCEDVEREIYEAADSEVEYYHLFSMKFYEFLKSK